MREGRCYFDGAIYHVTTRCNNREYILNTDNYKRFIIKQLKEYNKKFDYELLGYVIMDNHYHLLIRTHNDSISTIMFNLNNVIAKFLNTVLNRTGHALEKRFHCNLIETDGQLFATLRYIHRNPIRANICDNIDKYLWSSHWFYKRGINSFVNIDFILDMLSDDRKRAIVEYMNLLQLDGDDKMFLKEANILSNLMGMAEKELYDIKDINNKFEKPQRITLDDIVSRLNISDWMIEEIRKGSKKQALTQIKKTFVLEALKEKYSHIEIAEFLNMDRSSVSKISKKSATQVKCDIL
ncbi:REP-associated tyrosine transposase [Caloramator proteoclasticus]|uniref:REP element-mobilizing transposase RayT n=1 Tax=Caloramator proteoclasticus DSM 10124 TaxID=1121262 RepID=A0A1M4YD86_9CLOT|nr:transposase [Caloramator proteoclasticus]SHF03725.1 REP element-mobilizing transposase RayT [Caloramator proteoclasticus DSM 10124]